MLKLRDNLFSSSPWDIHEVRFDPDQEVNTGSIFMTGNGYLGYRGTFPEDGAPEKVGCIVSDTYDNADGTWEELVNAPNGLHMSIFCDGRQVSLKQGDGDSYRRGLDFRFGEWYGEARCSGLIISVRRFASYDDIHCLLSRTVITAETDASLKIVTGIDGRVWNLNGNHFDDFRCVKGQDHLAAGLVTLESRVPLSTVESSRLMHVPVKGEPQELDPDSFARERNASSGYIFRNHELQLKAGEKLVLESYVSIWSGNDGGEHDVRTEALASMRAVREQGYKVHRSRHAACWDKHWRDFDVQIEGDPPAALMLRYNLYHAVICVPLHTDHLPIGARGLSCQAYQGAAFWDQEIFNMPMFLHCRPETARNILMYRYRNLDGARRKAEKLGYRGAFYPWISADTGDEICPSYFFRDVLSGRKIRNHFNDWQIHISPDITYAVKNYVETTGDDQFLADCGAEMVFEIARFLYSRAHMNLVHGHAEIIRVLGPDEYHENVDNNAYTNVMSREACLYAWEVYCWMGESMPRKLEELEKKISLQEDEPRQWRMLADTVKMPKRDETSSVIEQFDGYFELEDITPGELKKRLIDPQEYWGWPAGIAVETQVIKQADVMQLCMLMPKFAGRDVTAANWEYYAPRTQHGSSLSPSVYAVTGARCGFVREAYELFLTSCSIDLYNTNTAVSGGTFIGGIHTAACAAAWQTAVTGFAGLSVLEQGYRFEPKLPESWTSMKFSLRRGGSRLTVHITREGCVFTIDQESSTPVFVETENGQALVRPGEQATLN